MRTFRWYAPIIGAGALALSVLLPAPSLLKAEESGAQNTAVVAVQPAPQGLQELKSTLDRSDRATVALQALQMALTELGDGVTLVWRRPASRSRRFATIRAVSAAASSSRSCSAPTKEKSRAWLAARKTDAGRSRAERESHVWC
jgi:hypothetical protein